MKNIVILGWFGKGNYGDNLILQNEVRLLRELLPNSSITVLCGSKNELKDNLPGDILYEKLPAIAFYRLYKFLDIFYFYRWIRLIIGTDILILGGGGFFSDRQTFAIPGWLRWCKVFSLSGSQVYGFGMGMGPFSSDKTKKKIFKSQKFFQTVSLRDETSVKFLNSTGFDKRRILQTIDPAFFTEKYVREKKGNIGCIVRNKEKYFIKELKRILKETDYNIVLIITDILDIEVNQKIFKGLNDVRISFLNTHCLNKINKTIASCDFLFSQRLHGSIISFTQETPFLNIYYHHKGKELGKMLDIKNFSINEEVLENTVLMSYIEQKNNFNFINIDLNKYKNKYIGKIN